MDEGSATEEWSLPGYRLGDVLGRGGFATVYRAHQLSLGRDVAVKMLTADLATDSARRRFDRERQALVQLSPHPHVVDVFDAGITPERRPYLVMRLYPGGSLADRLAERGHLPVDEVTDVVTRLASALDAAHEIGMLHRDVKPQNVLITETGDPVLADFGIAGLVDPDPDPSRVSTAFFSVAHVAPEILDERRYSVASDVYALASTTYQLLSGEPAFRPSDPRIGALILDTPPPPITVPGVPEAVSQVVLEGMAKDPAARPATPGAFAEALVAAAGGSAIPAAPSALSQPSPTQPAPTQPASMQAAFTQVASTQVASTQPASTQPASTRSDSAAPPLPGPVPSPQPPPASAAPDAPDGGWGGTRALPAGRSPVRIVLVAAAAATFLLAVVVGGVGYLSAARHTTDDPGGGSGETGAVVSETTPGTPSGTATAAASTASGTVAGSPTTGGGGAALPPGGSSSPTCDEPGDLRELGVVGVSGDAKPGESLAGGGWVDYRAGNLVDDDTTTAWVEGAPGNGVGQSVRVVFSQAVEIRMACVVNGYGKSWDVYRRNARVRDLVAVTDTGHVTTRLTDAGTPEHPAVFQEFAMPPGTTNYVELVIDSAYPAVSVAGKTSYADTCLSEVRFWYAPA